MTHADWQGVCDGMKMANGLFWPIPITLSTDTATAETIKIGGDIALIDPDDGSILATMKVTEKYSIDKAHECATVFKTTDPEASRRQDGHGTGRCQSGRSDQGSVARASFPEKYGDLFLSPKQTRAQFEAMGWSKVAAFQTRNPMHRSHEYLAKIAIETCDGVLIHSLLGNLKPGDIPAEVRAKAIATLTENYFVKKTVVQAGYPLDMRYAGPREALLHALFRQNYGCSHQIVGRDHAGVGSYYGPFDAHHIFDQLPKGALETEAAEDRLDLLVLQVRRHGFGPHLPARRCRPPAGVRHQAAQDRCPKAAKCPPSSVGRRCWRCCATTTPGLAEREKVEL